MATLRLVKAIRSDDNITMNIGTHEGVTVATILVEAVRSDVRNTMCRGVHEGVMD